MKIQRVLGAAAVLAALTAPAASEDQQATSNLDVEQLFATICGFCHAKGGRAAGTVTSGTFAPTLQASLAMALIDPELSQAGTRLELDVRGHREPAAVVELPFYRRSQAVVSGQEIL